MGPASPPQPPQPHPTWPHCQRQVSTHTARLLIPPLSCLPAWLAACLPACLPACLAIAGQTISHIKQVPGWNERLASDAEAIVKAEHDVSSLCCAALCRGVPRCAALRLRGAGLRHAVSPQPPGCFQCCSQKCASNTPAAAAAAATPCGCHCHHPACSAPTARLMRCSARPWRLCRWGLPACLPQLGLGTTCLPPCLQRLYTLPVAAGLLAACLPLSCQGWPPQRVGVMRQAAHLAACTLLDCAVLCPCRRRRRQMP